MIINKMFLCRMSHNLDSFGVKPSLQLLIVEDAWLMLDPRKFSLRAQADSAW